MSHVKQSELADQERPVTEPIDSLTYLDALEEIGAWSSRHSAAVLAELERSAEARAAAQFNEQWLLEGRDALKQRLGLEDDADFADIAASIAAKDTEVIRLRQALLDVIRVAEDREAFVRQGPRAFARAVQIAETALGPRTNAPESGEAMKMLTTEHELHKPIEAPDGYEFIASHLVSRTQSARWGDTTSRATHIVCLWREANGGIEVEKLREEVAREGRESARYLMLLQNILRARNPEEEQQNKERARRAIGE